MLRRYFLRPRSFHLNVFSLSHSLSFYLFVFSGYDLDALGDSVAESVRGLCGQASKPLFNTDALYEEPTLKIEEAVEAALSNHSL